MVHTPLDRPRNAEFPAADRPPSVAPLRGAADDVERRRRFDRAREILETARVVIERGWLQHGWYLADRPRSRSLLDRLRQDARLPEIDEVRRACLVAAVTVAAHERDARPAPLTAAGPALDLVWDALWQSRGQAGAPMAGRANAPAVRAAQARELVRWNDDAERTRDDVLDLLDRAISRGILGAVGGASR